MGLNVKRTSIISLDNKMELDKKGVGINLEGKSLKDLLESVNKKSNKTDNKIKEELNDVKNIFLEKMTRLHMNYCDEICWKSVNNLNPPYDINMDGPNKEKEVEKYENFQLGFIEKVFRFLGEKKKAKLLHNIEKAEKKDRELYSDYEKLNLLSERIINGNIDGYFQVIDEMRPFDNILKLGSEIEIGTNDSDSIEVEFNANSEKVIPMSRFDKEIKAQSDSEVKITYYEIVEEYICSSMLLIAKNIINLIPVNKVVIHAVDNAFDIDKGIKTDITIVSIVFDRETLNKIDLKTINPVDALDYFICNIRHQKTFGFKSVERIVQY